jgi:hypothetical protein
VTTTPAIQPGAIPPVPLRLGGAGVPSLTTAQRLAWKPAVDCVAFDETVGGFFEWTVAGHAWIPLALPGGVIPAGTPFAGGIVLAPPTAVFANYSVKQTDSFILAFAAGITITLRSASSTPPVENGERITIQNQINGLVTIAGPIQGGTHYLLPGSLSTVTLVYDKTFNTWLTESRDATLITQAPIIGSAPSNGSPEGITISLGMVIVPGWQRSLKQLFACGDLPPSNNVIIGLIEVATSALLATVALTPAETAINGTHVPDAVNIGDGTTGPSWLAIMIAIFEPGYVGGAGTMTTVSALAEWW